MVFEIQREDGNSIVFSADKGWGARPNALQAAYRFQGGLHEPLLAMSPYLHPSIPLCVLN